MTQDPQSSARRFGGAARIYGDAGLGRLQASHVCVIGVGGVGSWAVEGLARSGVGRLTLIDADHVAESNINRQLPALESTLGRAKTDVLAERVRLIDPHCRVHCVEEMVDPDNVAELLPEGVDWVVDCSDQARAKVAIIEHCRRHRIAMITSGGAGGRRDPTRIQVSDLARSEQDPLLAKVRRLLRDEHAYSRNPRRKFGVPCVWSEEAAQRAPKGTALSCAGGIGSAVAVTASFGFAAIAHVLDSITAAAGISSAEVAEPDAAPAAPRPAHK